MTANKSAYVVEYQGGYGITVPEGCYIGCHKQVIECELNVKAEGDFGIGNCTHLDWLLHQKQKCDVFCCDNSALTLDSARHLLNAVDSEHFVSKMSGESNYSGKIPPIVGTSMRRVELQGRLDVEADINLKAVKPMLFDYRAFEKNQVGYYDSVIREDEGYTKHLTFVGRKP